MSSARDGESDEARPDPDRLLAQIAAEELRARDAVLKIFFGYSAGVGKTYAMLEAALAQKRAGVDVVVGYVEPHGRTETETLAAGLEQIPPLEVAYRGIALRDFNLQAALERRPQMLIVDELAHTNAAGMRHRKRWQDILDLLDAGISVYTTMNVQHLDSLNDVIAKVTGVVVRETVPDEVFDRAAQIEIIDLPPEELIRRFEEGKVYLPDQARAALTKFFQRPNLVALREIALRRAADRVNIDVEGAVATRATVAPRAAAEQLLVCVGPSETSADVIRHARRMALVFHAKWIALSVETSRDVTLPADAKGTLYRNLRLAEELGAEVVTIHGEDVPATILDYARRRSVTKIVIGKHPDRRALFPARRRNIVGEILDRSGDIAIYVIPGERPAASVAARPRTRAVPRRAIAAAIGLFVATNLVSWGLELAGLSVVNIVMVFVLGVFLITLASGRLAGIAASIAGVLSFDFFFVNPRFTVAVSDTQYFITFFIMLCVTLVTSTLASRISRQALIAEQRERRTEALYRLSRSLSRTSGRSQIASIAESELASVFKGEAAVYLRGDANELVSAGSNGIAGEPSERAVAQWALEHNRLAGLGTDTLPGSSALYLPLAGAHGAFGVIGIRPREASELLVPEQRSLLETFAAQIASALERDELSEVSSRILVQAESERLRSSLLRSISHDMRSPLAGISGASSTLLERGGELGAETRERLLRNILDDSTWLTRLVENLLSMTRLESENLVVKKEWEAVDDIIASALLHHKQRLVDRKVTVAIPTELTMVPMEGGLIEQVLGNLLDNAVKYTPPGSPIDIQMELLNERAYFRIGDHGPGIPPADLERVFAKFYRGARAHEEFRRGAGLGLSICKAIVEAHGGQIEAANRPGGGALFSFWLPVTGRNPLAAMHEGGR